MPDPGWYSEWGYWVDQYGVQHPLAAPAFFIPELDREYIDTRTPGLTLWTHKRDPENLPGTENE
jgi:hypothetical protein